MNIMNRQNIYPYTFIYYIEGDRIEIIFSSSSKPEYKVESVRDNCNYFTDGVLVKKVWNKIKNTKDVNHINLMLKLNKILGVKCMAFNYNA